MEKIKTTDKASILTTYESKINKNRLERDGEQRNKACTRVIRNKSYELVQFFSRYSGI